MKRYKITTSKFITYKDSLSDVLSFVVRSTKERPENEIKYIQDVEIKFHHTSLEKYYVRKNSGFRQYYKGKFGEGFIEHIPNVRRKCSNKYHFIDYFIEESKREKAITSLEELATLINSNEDYPTQQIEEAIKKNGWSAGVDEWHIANNGKEQIIFDDNCIARVEPF